MVVALEAILCGDAGRDHRVTRTRTGCAAALGGDCGSANADRTPVFTGLPGTRHLWHRSASPGLAGWNFSAPCACPPGRDYCSRGMARAPSRQCTCGDTHVTGGRLLVSPSGLVPI